MCWPLGLTSVQRLPFLVSNHWTLPGLGSMVGALRKPWTLGFFGFGVGAGAASVVAVVMVAVVAPLGCTPTGLWRRLGRGGGDVNMYVLLWAGPDGGAGPGA